MTVNAAVDAGRLVLAPLEPDHLELLQRWDADPEVTRFTGRKFSRHDDPRHWLDELRASPNRVGFAIHVPGHGIIGDLELADIDPQSRAAELRICIGDKAVWGRGFGRDAVRAACRFAFATLGLSTVYLRVPLPHWRAIRCYLSCGFRVEGMLRAGRRRRRGWSDQLLMVVDPAALRPADAPGVRSPWV